MYLSIAALVAAGLLSVSAVGGVVGALAHSRNERQRWASGVWRDVTLRNGVTERSPFHSLTSSFNAPGMVEVFPRSKRPSVPAGVSADGQVCDERPRSPSAKQTGEENQASNGFALVDELPELPIELSDPAHSAEGDICRKLYQAGYSQTKLIGEVWSIAKGGGYRYSEARRRFRQHVRDIAQPALRASIEAEEVTANAE